MTMVTGGVTTAAKGIGKTADRIEQISQGGFSPLAIVYIAGGLLLCFCAIKDVTPLSLLEHVLHPSDNTMSWRRLSGGVKPGSGATDNKGTPAKPGSNPAKPSDGGKVA